MRTARNLFGVHNKRKRGFSLIELLIVISLFALVSVIVTISYIGFETREQVKNAAMGLKSDLRLVQNQAKTGDKGLVGSNCAATSTLAGWYVNVDMTTPEKADEYIVGGVCLTPFGVGCANTGGCEASIGSGKTVALPTGVTITNIKYGITPVYVDKAAANILFRPVNYVVTFHSLGAGSPPTFFHDTTGLPMSPLDSADTLFTSAAELVITLGATDGGSYQVKVTRLGDIEEKRI